MKINVVVRRIDNGVIVTKERSERFYPSVGEFFEDISSNGLEEELAKKGEYILSVETSQNVRCVCPECNK